MEEISKLEQILNMNIDELTFEETINLLVYRNITSYLEQDYEDNIKKPYEWKIKHLLEKLDRNSNLNKE